eukprot:1848995-Rhodomonas_salina.1
MEDRPERPEASAAALEGNEIADSIEEEREEESERPGREGGHRLEEANGILGDKQRDFGRRVQQAGPLTAGERVSEQGLVSEAKGDAEGSVSVSLSSTIVSLESEERTNTARI